MFLAYPTANAESNYLEKVITGIATTTHVTYSLLITCPKKIATTTHTIK